LYPTDHREGETVRSERFTFSFRKKSIEAEDQLVMASKETLHLLDDTRGGDPDIAQEGGREGERERERDRERERERDGERRVRSSEREAERVTDD
jgi:hypothetical protein